MKVIEERYLKSEIRKLNKYSKENSSFLDFFNNIDFVMDKTLQDLSFKSDLNFFNEISFILSVIISIISHPHLLNKGEEIIVRSELAPHLSNEMFNRTIRDSLLWKENEELEMIPQYVYYYQQIDELRIYENIFIVMLVKMIEQELNKYNDFYISTILTYNNQESLSINKDNSDVALSKMQLLQNRIKHIKNTYFYKEINKGGTRLGVIHPTNILTKDRLYNHCYKFYRKIVTYSDKYSRLRDIRSFYYVQFIKTIKEMGFKPLDSENISLKGKRKFIVPKTKFESDKFILTIYQIEKYTGLILEIDNKFIKLKKQAKSKHLLLFDSKPSFSLEEDYESIVDISKYDTVEILSLWNLGYIDKMVKPIYHNPIPEKDMINEWITSKLKNVYGSKKIYSIYCPSCKSMDLDFTKEGRYLCKKCSSKYTFYKNDKGESIWFNRLRRGF